MKIKINTAGMDALSSQLSQRLEEKRREIAEQIAEKARALAPVATGELRDSIHVDEDGNVVADAPHAIFVELGTSRRAATPFLAPAAVSALPAFEQAIKKAVGDTANGL